MKVKGEGKVLVFLELELNEKGMSFGMKLFVKW